MIFRFHFDGERVKSEDTPEGIGMQSGDCIEVMSEQDGGLQKKFNTVENLLEI